MTPAATVVPQAVPMATCGAVDRPVHNGWLLGGSSLGHGSASSLPFPLCAAIVTGMALPARPGVRVIIARTRVYTLICICAARRF